MISTIVRFRLPPGETHAEAMAEIQKTLPIYQAAAPALVRKAIHIDAEAGMGTSIYLWTDCNILVDNSAGEVHLF